MGESQPTLEMGPCLARHPQFGAYFRNCFKNLLLEHRVWRIEHCYTILRGVTSAVGVLLRPPCRRRDRRRRPSPSL